MMRRFVTLCLVCASSIVPAADGGYLVPIGPFQGRLSDDFNSYSQGVRYEQSIMGGAGVVRVAGPGSLKMEYFSSLGGRALSPHSPPLMFGQIGISEWTFNDPLYQFGGYFGNNSRFDDARVDFFDVNGALIDSVTATIPKAQTTHDWFWNGWQSDVPIKRIVITGNDAAFLHGFIWFDDVQANPVPAPSSLVLLGLSGGVVTLVYCGKVLRSRTRGRLIGHATPGG